MQGGAREEAIKTYVRNIAVAKKKLKDDEPRFDEWSESSRPSGEVVRCL
jgi:hypothetical protein